MNKVLVYLLAFALMYSCANPVAPTGGPKDTEAPLLIANKPLNGTTNLTEGKIELFFNEYFQLSKSEDNLLITPPMAVKPTFTVKGKKLVINLPDNLLENTTYNITFLNAIKDYNEANPLAYLNYVFSTGDKIDSSSISGVVKFASDNSPVENVNVGLYLSSDTAILTNTKPRYIAKTNASGQFKVNFVKDGTYVLAALKEENNNFLYDKANEQVSLITNPILIEGDNVLEQDIILFESDKQLEVIDYKLLGNNKLAIAFTKAVKSLQLDIDNYKTKDVFYFNDAKDTLFYHWSDTSLRDASYFFTLNDTIQDTLNVSYSNNTIKNKLGLENSQVAANQDIVLNTPFIISALDESKIRLLDSVNQVSFKYNIIKNKLILSTDLQKDINYSIQLDSTAITYFNAYYSQKSELELKVIEDITLGTLILNLNYAVQSNLTLHLLNSADVVLKKIFLDNRKTLKIEDLEAGTYKMKIFIDNNQNQIWDSGNFYKNLEPEKNLVYVKDIEIKNNWDKDLQVNF